MSNLDQVLQVARKLRERDAFEATARRQGERLSAIAAIAEKASGSPLGLPASLPICSDLEKIRKVLHQR